MQRVEKGTQGTGVSLGVCGEMGGRRLEALALMGIGIRRLSITPAAIAPIKELVCQVDLAELTPAVQGWLADPKANLREELSAWAEGHGIAVD